MSTMADPKRSPSPISPPRYRGIGGACAVAGVLIGIIAATALIGVGTIWLLTGAAAAAQQFFWRFTLLGAIVGSGVGLSRLICGGTADRLVFTRRLAKGDLAGLCGFLILLFLPGYLAEYISSAPVSQELPQVAIGSVVEMAGPTLDGGHFDLGDYRGKVVLVDFWAKQVRKNNCTERP